MEHFERSSRKYFLVISTPHDLLSWRGCCRELKLIYRGSISTLAFGQLMRLIKKHQSNDPDTLILWDDNVSGG